MDAMLSFVGNTLAIVMCFELVRKGYWRCAFLFVSIQCIQLLEIPALAILKVPRESPQYLRYYNTWHVFDEVNVPLELIAAWSIGQKRCGIGWVSWIMLAHLVLKEIHYAPAATADELTKNLVYYSRVLVNIFFEMAVVIAVMIRPAVKPRKEQQQCRKRRTIPNDLLHRIRTTLAVIPCHRLIPQTRFHRPRHL